MCLIMAKLFISKYRHTKKEQKEQKEQLIELRDNKKSNNNNFKPGIKVICDAILPPITIDEQNRSGKHVHFNSKMEVLGFVAINIDWQINDTEYDSDSSQLYIENDLLEYNQQTQNIVNHPRSSYCRYILSRISLYFI